MGRLEDSLPLEEPMCLCELDIVVGSSDAVEEPVEKESAHVDDRTRGTEDDDELEDICCLLDTLI
jgi:homoaconitase/3-isopropylmalate dehydratase large subunit